jgi:hypothetical protein
MAPLMLDAFGTLRPMEISACAPCNLFWFDKSESVRLTPKSVLEVFQFIGRSGRATNALSSQFNCPICSAALSLTHDLQRTTRFTYWRCRNDHGQLITFHHFLREKNFIRSPSPAELAKLRATVRQIACSQCGAPVDLATQPLAAHCGAPVALIDPDGVAIGIARPCRRVGVPARDPLAKRNRLSDAQIDAIFDLARMRRGRGERRHSGHRRRGDRRVGRGTARRALTGRQRYQAWGSSGRGIADTLPAWDRLRKADYPLTNVGSSEYLALV